MKITTIGDIRKSHEILKQSISNNNPLLVNIFSKEYKLLMKIVELFGDNNDNLEFTFSNITNYGEYTFSLEDFITFTIVKHKNEIYINHHSKFGDISSTRVNSNGITSTSQRGFYRLIEKALKYKLDYLIFQKNQSEQYIDSLLKLEIRLGEITYFLLSGKITLAIEIFKRLYYQTYDLINYNG